MTNDFEMQLLAKSSRELMQSAFVALLELATEITGRSPETNRYWTISRFFLMHFCDQFVFQESCGSSNNAFEGVAAFQVPRWTSAEPIVAKQRLSAIRFALSDLNDPVSVSLLPAAGHHKKTRRSRLVSMIGSSSAPILIADPYLKFGIRSEILAATRCRNLFKWIPIPPASLDLSLPESLSRERIVHRYSGKQDREGVLRKAIALSAPTELVEDLQPIEQTLSRQLSPYSGILYTANAFQKSPAIRHWVAESLHRGARLVTHQHGGGYGIDRYHLGEDHDIKVSDAFYTWGWEHPDFGHKVRSLPTAYPSRFTGKRTGDYLLFSLPITGHVYRLQAFLMPSHIERSVSETVAMINGLSSETRLRVRSSGTDGFPSEALSRATATITLDDLQEDGPMAASRAILVIHNYLGTSWLETLAMNVPTVCFYDPEIYTPREAAQPFVDALAKVGVIHYSGIEAAKFVNGLNGDPSAWWQSAEVQEAREAFVARYANFSENWLPAWIEEFERLLAE